MNTPKPRILLTVLLVLGWLGPSSLAQQTALDLPFLAEIRTRIAGGDTALDAALGQLRTDADEALARKPTSVTDKDATPPSGEKHDYMSVGPYWWPNPDTADGLPYIRRDGQTNPERRKIPDASNWNRMAADAHTLALASFLLGDEKYADHAALVLRTWFLDPDTRMNPHLRYGQAIPGRVDGRDIGLIDTRHITLVLDAVSLLSETETWTDENQTGMESWCRAYLEWLVHGEYRTEGNRRNNHATFYDVQVVSLAAFLGDDELARTTLEAAKTRRIAAHILPTGEQPQETARADGFSYSVFNLHALCLLAGYGDQLGVDLWHYETDDGRGIRKAFIYLAPYADGLEDWPHTEHKKKDGTALHGLIRLAAPHYTDDEFSALGHTPPPLPREDRQRLLVRGLDR